MSAAVSGFRRPAIGFIIWRLLAGSVVFDPLRPDLRPNLRLVLLLTVSVEFWSLGDMRGSNVGMEANFHDFICWTSHLRAPYRLI